MRSNRFFLLAFFPALAFAGDCENYCVGVRGNGEAEPAHPAALARMVEEFGMPNAMAGGSSATITMFLAEQVRKSPKATGEQDADRKRKIQALMLKTMPEFEAAMTKDAKIADGFGMMKAFSGGDPALIKQAIEAFQNAGGMNKGELEAAMGKYGALLNPELVRLVMKNPEKFGPEAVKSVANLGKFNAVTDDTLFFRPGLVDFKGVAVVLGYMADFYAGNTDPEIKARLDSFLDDCAEKTHRKEWMNAPQECRERFQKIAADYLKAGKFQNKALFEQVSAESLPTTAVLENDGMAKYLAMKRAFEAGNAKNIADFSIDIRKDLSFGYWGNERKLDSVNRGLERYREQGDLKAKKFRSLGPANWFEVLCCSPAEPGIANGQPIPMQTTREQVLAELGKPAETRWSGLHYRKDALSIGGWSDLHPTGVLKARPDCSKVVFLTRKASYGDSRFGQQIFIRLTGSKKQIPFWDKIGDSGPGGWCADRIKAVGGNPNEVKNTPWHQISNLCNPDSSFRRALDLSDATFCTDWDNEKHDVFQGRMRELVRDAYESPLIPTSADGSSCALNNPPSNPDARALNGCIPFSKRQPGSRPVPEPDSGDGARSAE